MGTFRVEVQAVGGHGCQREIKDGGTVEGCGQPHCPDCITREFVGKMKAAGCYFQPEQPAPVGPQPNVDGYARITHWPGQSGTVVDNLLTRIRSGSF